jgi:hypothetical protein
MASPADPYQKLYARLIALPPSPAKRLAQELYDLLKEKSQQVDDQEQAIDILLRRIEKRHLKHHIEYRNPLSTRLWEARVMSYLAHRIVKYDRYPLGTLRQYEPIPFIPRTPKVPKLSTTPTIAIVTPSFKQASFIGRTVASVLDQGYPQLQYTVQDAASPDGTAEILSQIKHPHFQWVSRPDGGQADALNRGFAEVSGDIMAYLNSDDTLLPGTLHIVADYFNRHPDIDVLYGHRLIINEDDKEIGRWYMPSFDSDEIRYVDYIPQETLFWRRRAWEKVGSSFDSSLRFCMDWDLLLRFRSAGLKFARIPKLLGCFRVHTQQKTSSIIHDVGLKEMTKLRRQEFKGVDPLDERITYFSHYAMVRSWLHRHLGIF